MKHHKDRDTSSGVHHNDRCERLVRLMDDCDLAGRALAARIGVHPNSVANWRTGKVPAPGAVIAYLDLLAKVKALGV